MSGGGVRIQALKKSFGSTRVLDGISLDVNEGEFLSLLGPSGCGKSTLLRTIAGLEQPDAGHIEIAGRAVEHVLPRDRDVAFVFQNYALYPHMSVLQNIMLPLVMRRLGVLQRQPGMSWLSPRTRQTMRDIETQASALASTLGLQPLLQRKPGQLSGGQRQRVALARAMVREPAVFLMDEPLSNLDAQLRLEVRDELVQLHRKLGVTFIYVTHDQSEAMSLSNRVAVMDGGRIRQLGTPRELYARPCSLDVARFVGSPRMNLLRPEQFPTPSADPGGLQRLRQALNGAHTPNTPLTIGLRGEHLKLRALLATADVQEGLSFRVRLHRVEHQGALLHAYLQTPDAPNEWLVSCLDAGEGATLETGREYTAWARMADLHWFDAQGHRMRVDLPS